jgi:hypothetical protein
MSEKMSKGEESGKVKFDDWMNASSDEEDE